MFIQNVSIQEIEAGQHFDCNERAVLIQIMDPASEFPVPKFNFAETHQFNFLDIEANDKEELLQFAMTDEQAHSICEILKCALKEKRNVIVHCHAGMCRSGAVAEVGIIMGFQDTEKFRLPNILVKNKLMKVLGLTYDSPEPLPMTDSGIIIATMKNYF